MSKFISRLITKKLTPEEDFQLFSGILEESATPVCSACLGREDATGDGASHLISDSSTATGDDNPGPGRVIDKHVYQKAGRKIEKIYFRFALPSLSTGDIALFISRYQQETRILYYLGVFENLDPILEHINFLSESLVISGLKVLLHRTR